MAKKVTPQKLFAAVSPSFGPQFAFNAKDEEHAKHLIFGYNRYHGFAGYADCSYTAQEIESVQLGGLILQIHNDWVN